MLDDPRPVPPEPPAGDRRRTHVLVRREVPATDPLAWLASTASPERFYWERPDGRFALAAVGAAAVVEVSGPDRFRIAAERARALSRGLQVLAVDGDVEDLPVLVGGFGFGPEPARPGSWNGFPPARLVLPTLSVVRRGDRAWVTAAVDVDPAGEEGGLAEAVERGLTYTRAASDVLARSGSPSAEPGPRGRVVDGDDGSYPALVDRALGSIRAGAFDKVVAARSVRVRAERSPELGPVLARLRDRFPACWTFGVGVGDALFAGATPERLVRLEGDRVSVDALAGSIRRGNGPGEDRELARALLESPKERAEHDWVVRALRGALERHGDDIRAPATPELLELPSLYHLRTPIRGRLDATRPFALVELLEDLHPSPAVGGHPRDAALCWLARNEPLERGWYSGLVGWLDLRGGGEMAVALRCALIRDRDVRLFAGAGIVDGSDPRGELAETELKLAAAGRSILTGPRVEAAPAGRGVAPEVPTALVDPGPHFEEERPGDRPTRRGA